MELHQLQCFYATARCENMTQAAFHMNISQPALSISVKKLEEELNAELFIRKGKRIFLSQTGKEILPFVKRTLSYKDEIERISSEHDKRNTVFVKLKEAIPIMIDIISEFNFSHPGIKIENCEDAHIEPDLVLDVSTIKKESRNTSVILEEYIAVAVPRIINPNPDSYGIDEMIHEHQVIGMSPRFAMEKCERFYFSLNNIDVKHTIICDNIAALRTLLSNGTGVAFVPTKTWKLQNTPLLHLVQYPGNPWIRYITLEKTHFRNNEKQVSQFTDFIQSEIKRLFKCK